MRYFFEVISKQMYLHHYADCILTTKTKKRLYCNNYNIVVFFSLVNALRIRKNNFSLHIIPVLCKTI